LVGLVTAIRDSSASYTKKAWIKAKWAETETGRKAKFYSLTAAGRAQLEKEAANWSRLSGAINLVVESA